MWERNRKKRASLSLYGTLAGLVEAKKKQSAGKGERIMRAEEYGRQQPGITAGVAKAKAKINQEKRFQVDMVRIIIL